jgi:hypothetical protein
MERLVVLRPELADLSRKFSSSFVCATSLMLAKRVANSWRHGGSSPHNRSSARVLEECINIRFGATFALFIGHLAPFLILQVDRTGSLSPCLAAGKLQQHRNRILTPRGRWMWHVPMALRVLDNFVLGISGLRLHHRTQKLTPYGRSATSRSGFRPSARGHHGHGDLPS